MNKELIKKKRTRYSFYLDGILGKDELADLQLDYIMFIGLIGQLSSNYLPILDAC